MTLKYRIFILFIFITSTIIGQPYGNEWINYSQSYYKFHIAQDGVHRISYSDLQSAGFPLSTDPRNIQLFGRGEEVAIHIQGEGDGSFDSGDYIEFYGRANDGFADEALYGTGKVAQPAYSLINDTIYYFLTWNSSTNNKRLQPENDVNYGSYTATSYVWRNSMVQFTTTYYGGKTESGGGTDPAYHETEGWFDLSFSLGGGRSRSVSTTNRYTTGPQASIHWRVMGASDYSRLDLDHHLNAQFAGITFDTIFGGYQVIDKHFTLPTADLGGSSTLFTFKSVNDLGSGADRNAIAFIEVDYPHLPDFGGQSSFDFSVEDQAGQTKTYLNFTGFNNSGTVWIIDLTNDNRIKVTTSAPNHQALIPNTGGLKECHVYSEGNVNAVGGIMAVNGNGSYTDYATLESSNGFLIVTNPALKTSANQYAAYRNTEGFGSLVADINELYDQFAYGIPKHPLSIRGFVEYVYDNWTEKPGNLFLIGKSVNATQHRKGGDEYKANLLPSYGNPCSDILLTAGLNQTLLEPLIPTGRLSAKTPAEVDLYLAKVMEYESNTAQAWMKNVLHFAGGKSGSEANRFISYLESYENIIKDTSFGGNVLTFRKNTTAPIQISLSDSIRGLVNNGTSIMTFFGHASSTGGFDQNIDEPENYNNKGKYPLLVGNSCFTGDIHDYRGNSVSERFVLIKDKGVIAFLASVDLGFEGKLNEYSRRFFQNLSQSNYGGSIGEHMKEAINGLQASGNNWPNRSVSLLMTLHGDPALIINSHEKPDYVITKNQVSTNPQPVTTKNDTFELNLQIFNHGKAINDSLGIEVIRFFPDMSTEAYFITSPPVYFEEKVVLKLPVDQLRGSGYNRLDISLDNSALIDELNEANNFVSVDLFIKSGDLIPAMPYEFAIVPEQGVELKASTGYAFEREQQYEIQLDTNDAFANPLETHTTTSRGGVISWKPSMLNNMKDSLVYFWRCRNTSGDENSIWRMSSFQYIANKRGWSQDHFHQFKSNNKLFLEMDNANREFYFSPSTKKLTCQTLTITPGNYSPLGDVLYKLDADLQEYGGCGIGSAIHIAVLDSLTFKPWGTPFQGQNANNDFGQINKNGNCGKNRVQNFFIFQANNASQLAGLKDMLQNKVPNGNYILAWTWIKNDFSKWDNIDPTMRSVFTNLGADSIASISNDSIPYIFFVKKGHPSTAMEVLGQNSNEFIYLNATLQNNATYGSMRSATIGPASAWDSLQWRHFSLSNPSTDSISLKMFGLAKDQQTVMADRKFKKNEKKIDISNMLNPNSAPYMNLDLYLSDNSNQTAAQIDRWTVLYDGVPELALNAANQFDFHNDTIQEGDMLSFSVSVKNISEYDADSVLIKYYIIDRNRKQIPIPYKRQRPLKADSSLTTSIEVSTLGLKGNNTLIVEVNPDFDQPEQHHNNNIGQLPFYVMGDNTNPILDVTFDGVHILDGDIVSAKPEISIQLTDDNEFLVLDDTSDFRVFVTNPQGQEKQHFFTTSNPNYTMDFMPASAGKNKARVQFNPIMTDDGSYALRVQATDKSKNESGAVDFRIGFEVINKSTITNLMNYPNPFSTSTRFVFVLTGSKVPDNMQIQIMTVSGKIVKNITMAELGAIRIGRNITSYAWDGRDQYGDKLANGVYLYRVNTRLNGSEIDHRSTSADKYFKQGFGKMVILR